MSNRSQDESQWMAMYGYMIIEFGDIGPELLIYENIPMNESDLDQKSIRLGVYLSLVVGQGKGIEYPGLYGPLPWNETPEHNLLVFAFWVNDPTVKDPRTINTGVIAYMIIFFPREENRLVQTRYSLEQSLNSVLNPSNVTARITLTYDSALLTLAQIKIIIWKSVTEGAKLLQEKAIETIMNDNRILYFNFYDLQNNSLLLPIKGDTKDHSTIIEHIPELLLSDITFSTTVHHLYKVGLIKFSEYQKVVLTVFDQTFDGNSFIFFINSVFSALPLLAHYYFL